MLYTRQLNMIDKMAKLTANQSNHITYMSFIYDSIAATTQKWSSWRVSKNNIKQVEACRLVYVFLHVGKSKRASKST